MINLNESIGKRMAKLRHEKGLSQEALAKKINCSPKHISHVERGVASMSLDLMIEACDVLECSLDYLVKGKSTNPAAFLPPRILEILESSDDRMAREKRLLLAYLNMYSKLRNESGADSIDPGQSDL